MKQHTRHSFSATRSSINSYDAREMTQRLTESVYKKAEESIAKEMRKKIDRRSDGKAQLPVPR